MGKWSSHFHGSNLFPSCSKCTEIPFSRPSKITILPFTTPQMSPVEEGIPFHTYPYPHMRVTFDLIYMSCCLLKCFLHLLIIFSGDPCNSKLIYSSNSSLQSITNCSPLKHCIHFLLSSLCPPTSNILRRLKHGCSVNKKILGHQTLLWEAG